MMSMGSKVLRGALLLGAAGLSAAGASLAQTAQIAGELGRVVVPMDHQSGFLLVEVTIDGKGPFLFQLDTFVSIDACVDQEFALAMGFVKTGTTWNSGGDTTRPRDLVRIDALGLGAAKFTHVRAMVDQYDWVDPSGRKLHGLLGFQLFRELLLTIDYPGSQLVLEHGVLDADDPQALPMFLTAGSPDVFLELDGKSLLFGIDTGMLMPMLLRLSDAEGMGLSSELLPAGRALSVYSSHELFRAKLKGGFELAGHGVQAPLAYFRKGRFKRLLGKGVLQPYVLTFDQKSKRLRVALPASLEKPPGEH